jgi:two-component system, LytTR family, sensor kinase
MPISAPAQTQRSLLRLGVFAGWLLFTLMVVAIGWANTTLTGRRFNVAGNIIWNLGWLFWAGGTFLVAWLARRFPLERPRIGRGLALHAALGAVTAVAILGTEALLGRAIEAFWPGGPRANAFAGFIAYKFHVYFLIYWMVLGATRAWDYYGKFRQSELHTSQLEARLAQAQLDALKAQLHPHFLFNTHHAIVSLMLKQDNNAAIKMLTRLSDLLRVTLRKTDQQVSSLREELDTLELYLGIQRERYGERLTVQRDIDPAALSAEVPWLVLQPLVENALQHGIDPLTAGGVLHISASVNNGRLQLRVTDNGPGFPPGFAVANSGGIGLRNTRARLERLYGDEQVFEIIPPAEVRVTLPLRTFQPTHA